MRFTIFILFLLLPIVGITQGNTPGENVVNRSVILDERCYIAAVDDPTPPPNQRYLQGDQIKFIRWITVNDDGTGEDYINTEYFNVTQSIPVFRFFNGGIIGVLPPPERLTDCYKRNEFRTLTYCYTAKDTIKLTLDTIPAGHEIELQVLTRINEAHPSLDTLNLLWLDKNTQKVFYNNNMFGAVASVFGEVPPFDLIHPCVDSSYITNEVLTTSTDVASSKCYKFIANGTTDFFGQTLYYRVGETLIYDNLVYANTVTLPNVFDITFEAYTNTDTDSTYFVNINGTELGEKPPKEDYISCESYSDWVTSQDTLINPNVTAFTISPAINTIPPVLTLPLVGDFRVLYFENQTAARISIVLNNSFGTYNYIVGGFATLNDPLPANYDPFNTEIQITYLSNVGGDIITSSGSYAPFININLRR